MSTEDASGEQPEGTDYVSDRNFVDFPLSREILQGILDHGYQTATPIQAAAIEPALAGRDLVARAKTGTGKTAAFAIPIIELIDPAASKPQALLLAPTRELAQQIAEEIDALSVHKPVSTAVLVGGLPLGPQEKALRDGATIVVGTPGRVLDHERRRNLDLSDVKIACLDEADEMVSMGFYEDVTKILGKTPEGRQVLLFSATISEDTERLVRQFLKDPEHIILSTDADRVEGIDHVLYEAPMGIPKQRALMYVIDIEDPDAAIVFCNTRQDTNSVAAFLDRQGLDVQLLSGELPQTRRSEVMRRVKAGEVRFLIATDVAARGIDISDLTHVFNYSLPNDPKVYLHRIGRTGRIGKEGTAISLIGGTDLNTRRVLESVHQIDFTERPFPDENDAIRKRVDRQAVRIREAMGKLVFESYLPTVRALKERPDADLLLAAALRGFFAWDRQRRAALVDVVEADGGEPESASDAGRQDNRDSRPASKHDRKRGRNKKDRDDDRPKRERSRKEPRGDKDRDRPRKEEPAPADDLDALLVAGDDLDSLLVASAPADAGSAEDPLLVADGDDEPLLVVEDKPKRKRKRKRKKKPATESSSDETPSDDGDGDDDDGGDDLDALLVIE